MKKLLLVVSATLTAIAMVTAVTTALVASNPETIARLSTTSGALALGSIGLFFIGLVTPKDLQ